VPGEERWSVVLAGGRGTRLTALTTVAGETIPKQYCALAGGASMLRRALGRAAAVSGRDHMLVVVTEEQRRWWERELYDLPAGNVVVQPEDRGTAAGILLPLAEVLRRAPEAVVTIVPADHHVEREEELRKALELAATTARQDRRPVTLVGVSPLEVDPELGWIIPGRTAGHEGALPVVSFREKPSRVEAVTLLAQGAVVNTFLFAASAAALWTLCERLVPEVALPLGGARTSRLGALYGQLPSRDFSRAVLERSAESLSVVVSGSCGWSDLGTPERVARCLRQLGGVRCESTPVVAALDLSRRLRHLGRRSGPPAGLQTANAPG
jgi:mannose-1-phosphate guanylyltransferase